FRPGESGMRYSYELPYAGNTATVKLPTVYATAKLLVLAPPSVQVTGDGLEPGGQEQGMTVYGRGAIPANTLYTLNISGTAPPLNAGGNGESGGRDAQEAPSGSVTVIPGRLDVLKWPLIGGFVGLFALGAIILARRPVVAVAAVGGAPATAVTDVPLPKTPPRAQATASASGNGAPNIAEVDAAGGASLGALT